MTVGRCYAAFKFEPRDIWIGVYWKTPYWEGPHRYLDVYMCLVPMLPLLLSFRVGTCL